MSLIRRLAGKLPSTLRARIRDWLPPALLRSLQPRSPADARDATVTATDRIDERADVAAACGRPLNDMLVVVELADAEFAVGDLFRRRYRTDRFPDAPRHFVGFYKAPDGALLPVGYVHHEMWNGCSLCGGLVIDDRLYRRIGAADRQVIRDGGGVAEAMLRQSFAMLPRDLEAIWAHVGDKQSEQVCLRVGYRHTDSQHVMVVWRKAGLSNVEKTAWVQRVTEHGPF